MSSAPRRRRPWGVQGVLVIATKVCGDAERRQRPRYLLLHPESEKVHRRPDSGEMRAVKQLYQPVGQTSEETDASVCSNVSEPLNDYRDIPANVAASAVRNNLNKGGLNLAFYLHPLSLPKIAPRHHPHTFLRTRRRRLEC